jgi:HD-GYP domain-containing protein (c-di-GMP phosphodiesterase class II)
METSQLDNSLLAPASSATTRADAAGSVLHDLNTVNKRLEKVLLELETNCSVDGELRELAGHLIAAIERNSDVALACIYLNQIAGLYAVRHCVETAIVVAVVARAMGKPQREVLVATAAALSMNVSMLRQTEGFQGKDAPLSTDERAIVRRHPADSADLLRNAGVTDSQWLDYVLLHHESDDGSGYPSGAKGDEIPQNARLISLADRYCANVSARNYRRSILPDVALEKLFLGDDLPADVTLARHFIEQIGKYPPGSLVKLDNGELGVVSHCDATGALTVHALRGSDGKPVQPPAPRSLVNGGCKIVQAMHEDDVGVRFNMKHIWGELAAL